MPLTPPQIQDLDNAIRGVGGGPGFAPFPALVYDYTAGIQLNLGTTQNVEVFIGPLLWSANTQDVVDGLSNVLYWGFSGRMAGIRPRRCASFRAALTQDMVVGFMAQRHHATLQSLGRLGMPQYSHLSFTTKILRFLDPASHGVLDQFIARLRSPANVLGGLVLGGTSIRNTAANRAVYDAWCNILRRIVRTYYPASMYSVADVEGGYFNLARSNVANGIAILDNA